MIRYHALMTPEMTESEKEHMELSRRAAGECMVLLENNGALPIAQNDRVALFGSGARRTVKGGTGSGDVNSRVVISIEQGLREAGLAITTTGWLDRYDRKCTEGAAVYHRYIEEEAEKSGRPAFILEFEHPMQNARPEPVTEQDIRDSDTDTAIYVISRNSGEGADRQAERGDYYLYEEEVENLILLGKSYEKVIVVLNIGGVMDLSELKKIEGLDAVLLMTQLGNTGGHALADVLLARTVPSGKLVDTWAYRYEDYPCADTFSHNDGNVDDEYYEEGIYVGYRYFDSFGIKPLYPFGYGLSYTEFVIETVEASIFGDEIRIMAEVTNTGEKYAGRQVVQVYYSAPESRMAKPYQELAAYKKTKLLNPGEKECVLLTFKVEDMASYCEECAAWMLEAGDYVIRAGSSSADTKVVAKVRISEAIKTEQLKNLFADSITFEEICAPKTKFEGTDADVPILYVKKEDVETKTCCYQKERPVLTTSFTEKLTVNDILSGKCTVEDLTAQLSVEEMATYCVGTQRTEADDMNSTEDGKELSIVGSASSYVPGAAGDTTPLLFEERGIGRLALADGPAGLRLTPHFKTDKAGNMLSGGIVFNGKAAAFDDLADTKEVINYYQYCTAIPIGWALAQAWDDDLLEEIGDMVGQEMKTFGIQLWLAPAMNIHRNPLCGRNFEYYSEDPLISGKAAAAMVRGVQRNTGRGATIKHFAVNSQEENRYFTNSHVHERALREIYLKGFEIAVKESRPLAIMTSYNLINGTHAANNYDLLQAAARDEWKFDGMVMTDWFTSQDLPRLTGGFRAIYPISASTGCIKAGNDLQMPGCKKNVDDIVCAVNEQEEIDGYAITLGDLQYSMCSILRTIIKCS